MHVTSGKVTPISVSLRIAVEKSQRGWCSPMPSKDRSTREGTVTAHVELAARIVRLLLFIYNY